MPEDEEREHIRLAIEAIEKTCGQPPVGWYTGRISANTRRLVVERGGFLYDSDSYADELPYWLEVGGRDHLVIPYTLDINDMKFLSTNGFVTSGEFVEYLVDSFEQLYADGGRMMNVGLHCRIVGRPGRAPALDRFLAHVKQKPDVWVTTRAEIARHGAPFTPRPQGRTRLTSGSSPVRSICPVSRVTSRTSLRRTNPCNARLNARSYAEAFRIARKST
jgi:peptidoglycan/xylan/chitin deacetylase (PgdA/CDA1 family)